MTDKELEARLRAFYGAEVGDDVAAPLPLRADVAAIPRKTARPAWRIGRGRGLTLLAAAALLLVGGAVAAGSGILRAPSVVPPELVPPVAAVATTSPDQKPPTPAITASPAPTELLAGALIAYIRTTEKENTDNCGADPAPTCGRPRLWIVGSDGSNAHELFPDGLYAQGSMSWSPDGSRLLYMDHAGWYLTDASGSEPRLVDTGCAAPCQSDWQPAFSRDGTRLVFVRNSLDASGYTDAGSIATLDLASGRTTVLSSTSDAGGVHPGWSPDGKQIIFWRGANKDMGGPIAPVMAAVFVIDADGQNLRQVTPKTLDAEDAAWSPDGSLIVFTSPDAEHRDVYTIRPDGTDLRRLTTGGISGWASWTPDGRILFVRGSTAVKGGSLDFWTMDADGSNAAELAPRMMAGDENPTWTEAPAWQPIGGAAIVPPPWTASTVTAVGPPPPTPAPTLVPNLSNGWSWTGSLSTDEGDAATDTATRLADGRVLVTWGCRQTAELYDPATGTFSPTGSLTATRSSKTATLLRDGRVLMVGGYNCASPPGDAVEASAELYDPATGTFSPTGSMSAPRSSHTATLLPDGRVLITGGHTQSTSGSLKVVLASYRLAETGASSTLASAEIYDPATGTFSPTGSMRYFRNDHTATLLEDGRVLVVGGGGEGYASRTEVELYDPATGRFSPTGSLKAGRWLHTATLLPDGRVLIAGGRTPKDSTRVTTEIYDPATGTFSASGSMKASRQQHTATLLPDGRVLVTGGYKQSATTWDVLASAELFDPATGTFSSAGSMGEARSGHTATLLADGRLLVAGGLGIGTKGMSPSTSAVLYQP